VRTLVTGATGFLGRHIVGQLLAGGHTVRALSRSPDPELAAGGAENVSVDLRDREATIAACRDIDAVFHTAGLAGVWGPWKRYYDANTLATEHVVAGCLEHGVERLVFTSTPSVTFDAVDQMGVDESVPYARRWLCHYPHSKALAEQHVLAANGCNGLLTCSLRPHLIWGPGDRHLIPRLIERRRTNRLWRVGDGTNVIDMVYIDNAAAAHLRAAERLTPGSPAAGQTYFITQGEPVRCWEWLSQILRLAGLGPTQKLMSVRAAWRVGALMEAMWSLLRLRGEPPMTRFLAAQLGTSHYFDISRAQRDLGYSPSITTGEGMQCLAADLAARGIRPH
jgi:2-alkyl-3-oxoalkanoate reductase